MLFVDLSSAYNTVDREKLYSYMLQKKVMERDEI